jgi:phosphatidylinositol alpha-1,6-mannosyltransferase
VRVPKTLLVTNDYPPRVGGIQTLLHSVCRRLPPDRIAVLAPRWEGTDAFDAAEPYEIERFPTSFAWPTRRTSRIVRDVARGVGAEVVLFGATYPLALMGPGLARGGLPYVCGVHGFEYWLSLAPGSHALMRRATGDAARVVVMSSRFVAHVVRTAVPARVPVSVNHPGVDLDRFRPEVDAAPVRERFGLGDRPVISCVSRLVRRKGQDVLIRAMASIRARVPDAVLLIVGEGPYRGALERLAEQAPPGSVVFAGEVDAAELPACYAAGDVFAMPCRNRLGGLEVEGLGLVFLEAQACGIPVVAGDSGGARESLIDGTTGRLVDGRDVEGVSSAIASYLSDRDAAAATGEAGRAFVERAFTWDRSVDRLAGWLAQAAAGRS